MYLPRTLKNFAKSAANQFPILLVTGARQVGKTTFLRHLSEPERTYVSLDGWSSPETLEVGAMSGAILETWVISELLKSYLHNAKQPPFYYYRDRDQKEIDLLIVQDGTIYPLEIKKTASPTIANAINTQ